MKRGWRTIGIRILAAWTLSGAGLCLASLNIESRYSPLNSKRPRRSSTQYIILHTTEGGAKGSLAKLRKYGEAHYLVDRKGKVTRIIHRNRIARHAGRSMWRGKTNLDTVSIGIEMVGYHDKPLAGAQKKALRELLRQLQAIYKIPDSRVLPHSMVAYGRPNRWHRVAHRGRKRCAMLMAGDELRRELGLHAKPRHDPDVRAGRLKVADSYLEGVLYGRSIPSSIPSAASSVGNDTISRRRSAWDIAREDYNAATTVYTFPDGSVRRGNQIRDWNKIPPGTRVRMNQPSARATVRSSSGAGGGIKVIGRDGRTAGELAGSEADKAGTIYFYPTGRVKRGNRMNDADFRRLPRGTGILVGYPHGGVIRADRRAFDICGPRWNHPTTLYRKPDGSLVNGANIDERGIPVGTLVFYKP